MKKKKDDIFDDKDFLFSFAIYAERLKQTVKEQEELIQSLQEQIEHLQNNKKDYE